MGHMTERASRAGLFIGALLVFTLGCRDDGGAVADPMDAAPNGMGGTIAEFDGSADPDPMDDGSADPGPMDDGGPTPINDAEPPLEPDAMVCPPAPRIVINEVVASNVNGLVDEDGETPDWIELFNAGDTPVALGGWGLSDDPDEPLRWQLPELTLQPGAFLLVLASDMDRDVVVSWDTRIDWGDVWRYLPVVAPPDPDWYRPDFDDSDWPEGPSGFGHADDDDATIVNSNTTYVRKTFELTPADRESVTAILLDVDYDDGFVAYLNGIEVARGTMGIEGTPPPWDAPARCRRRGVQRHAPR